MGTVGRVSAAPEASSQIATTALLVSGKRSGNGREPLPHMKCTFPDGKMGTAASIEFGMSKPVTRRRSAKCDDSLPGETPRKVAAFRKPHFFTSNSDATEDQAAMPSSSPAQTPPAGCSPCPLACRCWSSAWCHRTPSSSAATHRCPCSPAGPSPRRRGAARG